VEGDRTDLLTRRSRFLAEASALLAQSLDVRATLIHISEIAVPAVADWCTIAFIEPDGVLRRVSVVHRDPAKAELVRRYREGFPPDEHPVGGGSVFRTGKAALVARVGEEQLLASSQSPEHAEVLRGLGLHSLILAPMRVRDHHLGMISLVRTDDPPFGDEDLALAEEIAGRAALAIENGLLYQAEREARVRAEEADRRKDEFLGTLAHELRNPLAALTTTLALMERVGPADDRNVRLRNTCSRQVTQLARLVDDVLDVSRITRGKISLRREPLDFGAALTAAAASTAAQAEARKQKVEIDGAKEPLPVLGDPTRLEQIVGNLLDNASRYTPIGGRIEVTLRRDRGQAVMVVRDHGIGIPADMLGRVFDPFVQVGDAPHGGGSGVGMGLTLVKTLTELHGGQVEVQSAGRDLGTTFTLRIPLTDAPSRPAGGGKLEPGPRRVVVIEDNDDARTMLQELLSVLGHQVATARDGAEGAGAVLSQSPDVALIDIGLPGMDGYAVAQAIRADERGKGVLLVALTGYGGADTEERARKAGFDLHLVKPVDAGRLEDLLARAPRRD
jgi:signal transduction histidine kinase